jgi:N-acetylmuramic acid 6-phosphate etherase
MKSRNGNLTLGIEGGATKTTWVLMDDAGSILKEGSASDSNIQHVTDAQFTAVMRTIAFRSGANVTAIGAGYAGCQLPKEQARLRKILKSVWPAAKKIIVGEDTVTAYAAAHGTREGIIVICGTGSNVYGRREGRAEKAGGWGSLMADPGSGYDTARRGLQAVYEAYDVDRRVPLLGEYFLRATKQKTLEELVTYIYAHNEKSVIAGLGVCVFTAAQEKDPLALHVLQEGAKALAIRVANVTTRLRLVNPSIGLIGSLLVKSPLYLEMFTKAVKARVKRATLFPITTPGAVGAARLVNPHLPSP